MPSNPYYVFDGKLCKAEGMTKEQIINAIVEATGVTPQDVDAGFISTILETNNNKSLHIWSGTAAEYNALQTYDANTIYFINGDSTIDDLEAAINNANESIEEKGEDISTLQSDVSGLQGDVSDLKEWKDDSKESVNAAKTLLRDTTESNNWDLMVTYNSGGEITINKAFSGGLFAVKVEHPTAPHWCSTFTFWVTLNGYGCVSPIFYLYDGFNVYASYLDVLENGNASITSTYSHINNTMIYAKRIGADKTSLFAE